MKWIPASERMPNEAEVGGHSRDFLCTMIFGSGAAVVVASYHPIYGWAYNGRDVNVVAWQPLPEVYREYHTTLV